ncbi:tail fiber assembly protein [Pantoea agglomerans]|uniref:tail fiber assembly protein n=1 Tax=Enterobacter agglomerans TaxID=549 RepID=UPI0013B7DEC5|nr:tail fiber assembly protein [Pantoea agglomerans]NEG58181.1 tail fiber assembly protein [Pantoea agglomerans]NEG99894.1 tail fiber assembly protein [Pantoea agglomerans]NEH04143.1 tail fiber assembly protein [Pantoea agglomerans]NEH14454.1 tail fiber assembly protein [Pantoea agglomerans]
MLTLKNINPYTPEYYDQMPSCLYLKTEDGLDWYYHRLKFKPHTLKVCYGSDNIIRMASYDAERICPPSGCSVSEVAPENVPDNFDDMGNWVFDGAGIIKRGYTTKELVTIAQVKKNRLMTAATSVISLLQDAADLEIATEDEVARLKAWKTYRVLLNRVDVTAGEINWPDEPDV